MLKVICLKIAGRGGAGAQLHYNPNFSNFLFVFFIIILSTAAKTEAAAFPWASPSPALAQMLVTLLIFTSLLHYPGFYSSVPTCHSFTLSQERRRHLKALNRPPKLMCFAGSECGGIQSQRVCSEQGNSVSGSHKTFSISPAWQKSVLNAVIDALNAPLTQNYGYGNMREHLSLCIVRGTAAGGAAASRRG